MKYSNASRGYSKDIKIHYTIFASWVFGYPDCLFSRLGRIMDKQTNKYTSYYVRVGNLEEEKRKCNFQDNA